VEGGGEGARGQWLTKTNMVKEKEKKEKKKKKKKKKNHATGERAARSLPVNAAIESQ
jgi:hypothetical protein